jgi:hypothetical protein
MSKITFIESTLNPEEWDVVESDSILETLQSRYDSFPQYARIFAGAVTLENDVTPRTPEDIDALESINDDFYVVHDVADPITAVVAIVAVVGAVLYTKSQVPDVPEVNSVKNSSRATSPNNELGQRQNQGRPTGRVPDIYGRVKAVPDLLTNSYTTYDNNIEHEHSFLAIGRGYYNINANEIFEDTTQIDTIDDYTCVQFNPATAPNFWIDSASPLTGIFGYEHKGSKNDLREIAEVYDVSSVTGQTLIPSNFHTYVPETDSNLTDPERGFIFIHPNIIATIGSHDDDIQSGEKRIPAGIFSKLYKAGDEITLSNTDVDTGGANFDLDGTYTVDSVYQNILTEANSQFTPPAAGNSVQITNILYLSNPELVNANWSNLISSTLNAGTITLDSGDLTGDNSDYGYDESTTSQIVNDSANYFVGVSSSETGFRMERDVNRIVCNYVAQNGIRGSNQNGEYSFDVTIRTTVDLFDENDVFQNRIQQDVTLEGTSDGASKGVTNEINLFGTFPIVKVFSHRLTSSILEEGNQIQDVVKWRDMFGLKRLGSSDRFANITTLAVRVAATPSALKVKNRSLNMWVQRALPIHQTSGTTETTFTHPTTALNPNPNNRFSNVIIDMTNDPYIGRGNYTQNLDLQNLFDTEVDIRSYFGIDRTSSFNFTFDKNDMVFEEMVSAVARAVFCQAYREGEKILFRFDKEGLTKRLLFNHRNKLPNSEKRSIKFANDNDFDGVEIEYIDEDDGITKSVKIPENATLFKPKKISSVGILGRAHAYFHAHREFNRIRFQSTTVQFTATQEAATLIENDLILVSDNTRAVTIDGEVRAYDSLTYTLSQPIKTKFETISGVEVENPIISTPATLFIQMPDQTIESATITNIAEQAVTVSTPPSQSPVTDSSKFARTTYQIVEAQDTPINEFQVTKISTSDNWTFNITAVNHTPAIYSNDLDFINGVINADGETL